MCKSNKIDGSDWHCDKSTCSLCFIHYSLTASVPHCGLWSKMKQNMYTQTIFYLILHSDDCVDKYFATNMCLKFYHNSNWFDVLESDWMKPNINNKFNPFLNFLIAEFIRSKNIEDDKLHMFLQIKSFCHYRQDALTIYRRN